MRARRGWPGAALGAALTLACAPLGAESSEPPPDLTKMSIEELANIQVTSISKVPERGLDATGAIYVIAGDQIQRMGSTSLPEAIRVAPGVQASQINAGTWAVAVRGFASRLSRSVLVLIDGRSVWTPLFAGVYWEAQDTLLEDVDRIEVSRGPGGALFGANAINGVINVISRGAEETQGGLVTLGAGTEEKGFGSLRYGGKTGGGVYYRAYAKHTARDRATAVGPVGYDDSMHTTQGGFRVDRPRPKALLTLQGDVYDGALGERASYASHQAPFQVQVDGDAHFQGRNLLGRWTRRSSETAALQIQAYYDHTTRTEPYFMEKRDTLDLDAQHSFKWRTHHQTVVGTGYRASRGVFTGVPTVVFRPAKRTDDVFGVFAQDEWRTLADRLRITLGSKLEWNDYSGWELQPSARVGWKPRPRQMLWGSVSRAVRTSSRLEHDVVLDTSLNAKAPLFARALGSTGFRPETVVAYEAGYRAPLGSRVLLSFAGFYARYDDLATLEPGAPFAEAGQGAEPPRTIVPVTFANLQTGTTRGAEFAAVVRASPSWLLRPTYSFVRVTQTPKAGSLDAGGGYVGNSPRHQAYLASFLTVRGVSLDVVLRGIGRVPIQKVPAYFEADARVAFRPRPNLEIALVGQNLAHESHAEFGGGFVIDRGAYCKATLSWPR